MDIGARKDMVVMDKNRVNSIAFEVLIILAALIILCLITKLWPLVFLVIPVILIAALRLLAVSDKRKASSPEEANLSVKPRRPLNERDVISAAFGVLQRRIAEQVISRYPSARWVWSAPNSFERFSEGLPIYIMLNSAGGYGKATVMIHNMQFRGLQYETVESAGTDVPPADKDTDDYPPPDGYDNMEHTDYSVIAFEWVEANLLRLNGLCNTAIAKGENTLLITSDTLPVKDSWEDICLELTRNGFTEAAVTEAGINVTIPK